MKESVWELTEEGQYIVNHESPEVTVARMATKEGRCREEIFSAVGPIANVGLGQAMKQKWIKSKKEGDKTLIVQLVDTFDDKVKSQLQDILQDDLMLIPSEAVLKELKKRKLVEKKMYTWYDLSRGPEFSLSLEKGESDLTSDMIMDGSWKNIKFKQFNLKALGTPVDCGTLHPLMKVRTEYRQIFLEMGFEEMPTNRFIESSFWNFDSLFQPQQHPARDAHDTFFMKVPEKSTEFPPDYCERVRKIHEVGGFGSQGYKYDWKLEEAQKNILRTHTTAISSRMLYKLSQQKEFKPVKYFSIDRVFRNETLDATHLAEFHQIEGVIADYNLTLGDLIGTLAEFFKRLGIDDLRFKPAYNPYTEPSMEVFSYHKGLNKLVEIGNSGIFRPEMLRPMGLPEDVVVIAWGLSLERPTMIKYGYSNIRDLIGPKVNLQAAKEKPIIRL
eukprot:gene8325-872_t